MESGYGQFCTVARAAEILCERWTPLVVRELLCGSRRFNDLHRGVPRMSTSLLAQRLQTLEAAGVVQRTAVGKVWEYGLTEAGEELRPTARQLMLWSIKYFMERPGDSAPKECIFSNDLTPDSVALAIEMFSNESSLPHANYVLQLKIDDHSYTYYFMNKEMTARRGGDTPAVARIETDVATLMQAMRGEIYIDETKKRSKLSGETSVIDHFIASVTPGADVAFEVAEAIKQRRLEKKPPPVRRAAVTA